MLFFMDLGGDVLRIDAEKIYQGTNNAGIIRLVTPITPANTTIEVAFTYPNGLSSTYYPLAVVGRYSLSDLLATDYVNAPQTTQVYLWTITMPENVTADDGTVIATFKLTQPANVEAYASTEQLPETGESGVYYLIDGVYYTWNGTDYYPTTDTIAVVGNVYVNITTSPCPFTVLYASLPSPPTGATVTEIEQILTLLNQYATQTQGQVITNTENIEDLDNRLTTAENDIEDLQTAVGDWEDLLDALNERVTTAEGTVAQAVEDVQDAVERVNTVETEFAEIKDEYDNVVSDITDLQAIVGDGTGTESLTARMTQAENDIDDLQTAIDSQAVDISNKMDKANPTGTGSLSMNRRENTTVGTDSVTLNDYNTASGSNSTAIGFQTTASGSQSFASGSATIASGEESHAEGNFSRASGAWAHAEGYGTRAIKSGSHAEGRDSQAGGVHSAPAEIGGALSGYSHAEGYQTYADASYSHTEGQSTWTILDEGNAGHAEGRGTICAGIAGHAEGLQTQVNAGASHAEGLHTIANGAYQHVGGKYNIADDNSEYAEIIGNGTSSTSRSNARTLDWQGNEKIAGNMTVNKTTLANQSATDVTVNLPSSAGTLALQSEIPTTPQQVGADPSGTAANAVSAHNTDTSAHTYIQGLVSNAQQKADDAYALAEGRENAVSFPNYQSMVADFNAETAATLKVGDNVYIETLGVPDLWVADVLTSKVIFNYTTDQGVEDYINADGYVDIGWYRLSELETAKVDLSGYVPTTRKVEGGYGLTGGGTLTSNLLIRHSVGDAPEEPMGFYKFSTDDHSHIDTVQQVIKKDLTDLITSMPADSDGADLSLVTTGEKATWNAKQNALPSQTAYSNKGTATKVPTISTNANGQVTSITETDIAFPVTQESVEIITTATTGTEIAALLADGILPVLHTTTSSLDVYLPYVSDSSSFYNFGAIIVDRWYSQRYNKSSNAWETITTKYQVSSVNGKTGSSITLSASDVGALPSDTIIPTVVIDGVQLWGSDLSVDANKKVNVKAVLSVGAGTGLSISGNAAKDPVVEIASGYKLPTTTEWDAKADASAIPTNYVSSVNGQTGDVVLSIPTKTSDLTNDSGFITSTTANATYLKKTGGGITGDLDVVGELTGGTIEEGGVALSTKYTLKTDFNNVVDGTTQVGDAAKLNGQQPSYYLNYNNLSNQPTIPTKTSELANDSGFTSNTGTVTSVRVQAGTGLSSSQSTAQTGTLNTTISVASGYKLPTTAEWNAKADTSAVVTSVNGQTGAVTGLATSNPNLLTNSNFLINHRRLSTYSTNGEYTVDEWRLNGSGTLTVNDNGVSYTTTGAWQGLKQYVQNPQKIAGETVTLSIKITALTGTLYLGLRGNNDTALFDKRTTSTGILTLTGVIPSETTSLTFTIWGTASGVSFSIEWAKLELGATATTYTPPIKSAEKWATIPESVLSKPNILINSNFAINQRAGSSYTANNKYTVDRWLIYTGGSGTTVEPITNGGVTVSNNSSSNTCDLTQIIEDGSKLYSGKELTLSVNTTIGGSTATTILSGTLSSAGILTANLPSSSGQIHIQWMSGGTFKVWIRTYIGKTITYNWAKLEIGSVATEYVLPNPAEELIKCLRYFFRLQSTDTIFIAEGHAGSATTAYFPFNFPVPMRNAPSTVVPSTLDDFNLYSISGSAIVITNLYASRFDAVNTRCTLNVTSSGLTSQASYILRAKNPSAYIDIDAELY